MKPELISFKLCPFVQRSVIVLQEKDVAYDIRYLDIRNPPDWFKAISPLGKVPLLRVGETVLFESSVIMEYLDEVYPPSLHPAEPLHKAQNRAWIEFASSLLVCQFNMVTAADQVVCEREEDQMRDKLRLLARQVKGPFFNGEDFMLIDAAYAPLLMRLALLEEWAPIGLFDGEPVLQRWSQKLLARPSVAHSVVPELPELYRNMIGNSGGYGAERFG